MAGLSENMAGLPLASSEIDIALGFRGSIDHQAGFTERRLFDDWNLWIPRHGRVEIATPDRTWQVTAGQAFLFTPDTEYSACFHAETNLLYCHFALQDLAGHRRLVARLGPSRQLSDAIPANGLFLPLMDALLADRRLALPRLKAALAEVLLAEFPALAHAPLHALPDIDPKGRLLDYIGRNCQRPITVHELAGLFGMGPDAFNAWLHATAGINARTFLLTTRLEIGRRLLSRPGATIKEAAAATGYRDEFAFAKAFKRHFGQAPARFVRSGR